MAENTGEFDREKVISVFRNNLRKGFPLYEETQRVDACKFPDGKIYLGYGYLPHLVPNSVGLVDLNIDRNICYLLHVQLREDLRGKNHGHLLYKTIEETARDFGCEKIRQTPSGHVYKIDFSNGTAVRGESRRSYLTRKLGYRGIKGSIEVEKRLV